jgi:chromosomal replication initiator protein
MSVSAVASFQTNLNPELGSDMVACWEEARPLFLQEFGEATFKSWLSSLTLGEFMSGRLILKAPTRFMRDWIQTHFSQKILEILQRLDKRILTLDLIVASNSSNNLDKVSLNEELTSLARSTEINDLEGEDGNIHAVGSRLEPRYTFEAFVVGKSNELAYAAARRIAEADKVTFNPLFLYGGVGLGKTHLMHAIAWHICKTYPNRSVIYLSAEKFMYLFVKALRFKDTMVFKEQFRSVDVLMIDDFQFISGKDSTQEEFFHTFNALVDQNHQVIISADKSPSDLKGLEERMRSRLGWGLVADIHPMTYELGLGILQSKSEQMGREVPLKVLEFLARKITSNARELEGALNRLIAHSMLVGREITIESASEVLRDLLRSNDRRISVEEIQKKVAEHFNVKLADMHSHKRLRSVARPRQIAMFLAKQLTPMSLPEIGSKFGGRDHTTVIHAVRKVEELKEKDISLAEDLDLLKRVLQA